MNETKGNTTKMKPDSAGSFTAKQIADATGLDYDEVVFAVKVGALGRVFSADRRITFFDLTLWLGEQRATELFEQTPRIGAVSIHLE